MPRSDIVAGYLVAHPDLTELVGEMAAALVEEFRGERSELELTLYQDPEIEDQYLVYYVRVAEYDDSLMPRLRAATAPFLERRGQTDGWVLATTEYEPLR